MPYLSTLILPLLALSTLAHASINGLDITHHHTTTILRRSNQHHTTTVLHKHMTKISNDTHVTQYNTFLTTATTVTKTVTVEGWGGGKETPAVGEGVEVRELGGEGVMDKRGCEMRREL